jgi:hypothetical protein
LSIFGVSMASSMDYYATSHVTTFWMLCYSTFLG